MIPIIARLCSHNELAKPFDAPASDLSGYHSSQGFAVIWLEHLAVHSVCKHDSAVWVHYPIHLYGSPVEAVGLPFSVSI